MRTVSRNWSSLVIECRDWTAFRPVFKIIYQKQRKSNAGRKPNDATLMFKMLVLQSLYSSTLFPTSRPSIRCRTGCRFNAFSGLAGDTVPGAKTL
jgi:hypothetical protein